MNFWVMRADYDHGLGHSPLGHGRWCLLTSAFLTLRTCTLSHPWDCLQSIQIIRCAHTLASRKLCLFIEVWLLVCFVLTLEMNYHLPLLNSPHNTQTRAGPKDGSLDSFRTLLFQIQTRVRLAGDTLVNYFTGLKSAQGKKISGIQSLQNYLIVLEIFLRHRICTLLLQKRLV